MVENLAGYVQRDLLVPAELEQPWPDLAEANSAARLTLLGPDGLRQPASSLAVDERLIDVSWSPKAAVRCCSASVT